MRQDWKDARLEQVFAGIFEQARIALPAHDVVVDSTRFFARSDLAYESSIAVPDCKLSHGSRFRNRKQVCSLECHVGVVAKYLFDVGGPDLRTDLRVDLDRLDRKRARQRD